MAGPILEVEGLSKQFARAGIVSRTRGSLKAVDRVSFSVEAGETFGLVGESGCGKTTLARALLYLDPPTGGVVRFEGTALGTLPHRELRAFRKRMQIVFQDPNGALDPKMSIRSSMAEGLVNLGVPAQERRRRMEELLELVGIQSLHADRYPHEFSGGQKQRIVIARALSMDPALLVLDEPVSNLDVSIQAQIINLLLDLKARLGLTYLFISHDLNLVAYLSDRVGVMFRGRIVELGSASQVIGNPLHPYTRRLFASVPRLSASSILRAHARKADGPEDQAAGETAAPRAEPAGGCPYAPRCSEAQGPCGEAEPQLHDAGEGHLVACIRLPAEDPPERPHGNPPGSGA